MSIFEPFKPADKLHKRHANRESALGFRYGKTIGDLNFAPKEGSQYEKSNILCPRCDTYRPARTISGGKCSLCVDRGR